MDESVLVIPRRLAVRILHAAQAASPASIRGVVGARGGEPDRVYIEPASPPPDEPCWARVWSNPQRAAVPGVEELADGALCLVVSLNTKGVLELRAWRLENAMACEQPIAIKD
ncbi:hypothetical protein SAMN04488120_10474 [Fontimonas thermophila]|uniref:Uncharacterized protein n=1 Tax=Fontimonas thermophila TaxID=1076937 RepID=A0A1I2ILV3_9GAMM|nr:hypothetical protein [Fontimonas thermophila]SFF43224.1 hypothetical protein SAMN04488120_10474 [Fontimonas thermophila]